MKRNNFYILYIISCFFLQVGVSNAETDLYQDCNEAIGNMHIKYVGEWDLWAPGRLGVEGNENQAKVAVRLCLKLFNDALVIENPIRIKIIMEDLGQGTHGSCSSASMYLSNSDDSRYSYLQVNASLFKQKTGKDPDEKWWLQEHKGWHMVFWINSRMEIYGVNQRYPWFFGPEKVPANHYIDYYDSQGERSAIFAAQDFISTVLHELGHGFGFLSNADGKGTFTNGMPRLFDYCLCYSDTDVMKPFMSLYPSEITTRKSLITSGLSDDGMIFWGGYYDPKENVIDQDRTRVAQYMNNHPYPPAVMGGGYVQLYTPETYDSATSVSHWTRILAKDLIMAQGTSDNPSFRDLGLLPLALHDIGWDVKETALSVQNLVFTWEIEEGESKSVSTFPINTFRILNNSNDQITLESIELFGKNKNDFQIIGGIDIVPISIPPCSDYSIEVQFCPDSIGIKIAYIRLQYHGVSQHFSTLHLCGYAINTDTDNDGLSDFNEQNDLDSSQDGIQNPFNSEVSDSTGNNKDVGADGIIDGLNDWDGDGINNADEFALGTSPLDCSDTPSEVIDDGISASIKLKNEQAFPLRIQQIDIEGMDENSFFITYGNAPFELLAHSEKKVGIVFLPTEVRDSYSANMHIKFNAGGIKGEKTIRLTGNNVGKYLKQ